MELLAVSKSTQTPREELLNMTIGEYYELHIAQMRLEEIREREYKKMNRK